MADVLEHVPYPKEALQAARRLLCDGGVLFVSMPNMESIVWKVLEQQNANPYWGRYGISERYRVCMEVIAKKQ